MICLFVSQWKYLRFVPSIVQWFSIILGKRGGRVDGIIGKRFLSHATTTLENILWARDSWSQPRLTLWLRARAWQPRVVYLIKTQNMHGNSLHKRASLHAVVTVGLFLDIGQNFIYILKYHWWWWLKITCAQSSKGKRALAARFVNVEAYKGHFIITKFNFLEVHWSKRFCRTNNGGAMIFQKSDKTWCQTFCQFFPFFKTGITADPVKIFCWKSARRKISTYCWYMLKSFEFGRTVQP